MNISYKIVRNNNIKCKHIIFKKLTRFKIVVNIIKIEKLNWGGLVQFLLTIAVV